VPSIVSLNAPGQFEFTPVDSSRVVKGTPAAAADNRYSSADGCFHAGLWSSTVGSWRIAYTEDEACTILRGRVRLTGDDGNARDFGPGDAFVIPAGFTGTWETLEDCLKHYVIYERT
jgi:uncharacterized cupin superfamily protein